MANGRFSSPYAAIMSVCSAVPSLNLIIVPVADNVVSLAVLLFCLAGIRKQIRFLWRKLITSAL